MMRVDVPPESMLSSPTRARVWVPVKPRPSQQLTEYIECVGAGLTMSWAAAAHLLGASDTASPRHLPSAVGLWMAPHRLDVLAGRVGVDEAQVRSMLINRWAALLPEGLQETNAARMLLASGQFRVTGCPYCPECLKGGWGWQVPWRLAWVHSCTRHDRLLVEHCPRCGLPARSGSATSPTWRPGFAGTVPTPDRCSNRMGDGRRCGADLTDVTVEAEEPGGSQTYLDDLLQAVESQDEDAASELRLLFDLAGHLQPAVGTRRVGAVARVTGAHLTAERLDRAVAVLQGTPRRLLVHQVQRVRRANAHGPVGRWQSRSAPLPGQGSAADELPMMLPIRDFRGLMSAALPFHDEALRRHLMTLVVREQDGCGHEEAARRLGWPSPTGWYRIKRRLTAVQRDIVHRDVAHLTLNVARIRAPYGMWRLLAAMAMVEQLDCALLPPWHDVEDLHRGWWLWARFHGDCGQTFPYSGELGVSRPGWLHWVETLSASQSEALEEHFLEEASHLLEVFHVRAVSASDRKVSHQFDTVPGVPVVEYRTLP